MEDDNPFFNPRIVLNDHEKEEILIKRNQWGDEVCPKCKESTLQPDIHSWGCVNPECNWEPKDTQTLIFAERKEE